LSSSQTTFIVRIVVGVPCTAATDHTREPSGPCAKACWFEVGLTAGSGAIPRFDDAPVPTPVSRLNCTVELAGAVNSWKMSLDPDAATGFCVDGKPARGRGSIWPGSLTGGVMLAVG